MLQSLRSFLVLTIIGILIIPPQAYPCTIFMQAGSVGGHETVLIGNNEDNPSYESFVHFVPGQNGKHGKLFFTVTNENPYMNDFPQGGMNDAGLFYDITATPHSEVEFPAGSKPYNGYFLHKILDEATTVQEAIAIAQQYVLVGIELAQVFFADKNGTAAVLGVGKDKRVHATYKTRNFLVLTNFNLLSPETGNYPDTRYNLATTMLQESSKPTIRGFRKILSAVHTEGRATTVYSNIYDLSRVEMTLYYFHNYEQPVRIRLAEELKKGARTIPVSSLFNPQPFSVEATKAMSSIFDILIKYCNDDCKKEVADWLGRSL